MKIPRRTAQWTTHLMVMMSFAVGAFQSPVDADTTVEFVEADAGASAKGVVGYVVANEGGGEVTTFVLANGSSPIIENNQATGCLEVNATVDSVELTLFFTEGRLAQFIQGGVVVAEVSPDGAGGWNHWGTETLVGNAAFEALLVATGDTNLQMLAQSDCTEMGYWDCVLKVLECEGYTAACLAQGFMPDAGSEACAVPSSPDCVSFLNGLDLELGNNHYSPCKQAKTCWQQASDHGCVPW